MGTEAMLVNSSHHSLLRSTQVRDEAAAPPLKSLV